MQAKKSISAHGSEKNLLPLPHPAAVERRHFTLM
jgi:hypothetical protein